MEFKFNDFIVLTEQIIITTDEKIITAIKFDKYSDKPIMGWKNKTKEITIFNALLFREKKDKKHYRVIADIFVFIDLIEILKAFSGNKLNTEKKYKFSNNFIANIVQKNDEFTLKIHFKNYSNYLFLDKFECNSLAAKFSKILNRCEAWQELDQ